MEDNRQVIREFLLWFLEKKGIKRRRDRVFIMKYHDYSSMKFLDRCICNRGIPLTSYNVFKLRDLLGMTSKEMKSLVLEMKGEVDGKEN